MVGQILDHMEPQIKVQIALQKQLFPVMMKLLSKKVMESCSEIKKALDSWKNESVS